MRKQPLLTTSVGFLMLITACQLFSISPTPVPKTIPTSTTLPIPTSLPTFESSATQAVAINLPFFDDFSTNLYGWQMGLVHGDYADTNYEIVSGVYRWTITSNKNAPSIAWPDLPALSTFTLTVDAQLTGGWLEDSSVGVIYRSSDGQEYFLFQVSNLQFNVTFHSNTSGFRDMIPWSLTPATMPGGVNRLKLIVTSGFFDFYINDTMVTRFIDDRIPEGVPGLYVGVFGKNASYEFDNFSVTNP
jgi:hypothetical protein